MLHLARLVEHEPSDALGARGRREAAGVVVEAAVTGEQLAKLAQCSGPRAPLDVLSTCCSPDVWPVSKEPQLPADRVTGSKRIDMRRFMGV